MSASVRSWRVAHVGGRAPIPDDQSVDYLTIRAADATDSPGTYNVEAGHELRCGNNENRWVKGGLSFQVKAVRQFGARLTVPTGPPIAFDPGFCDD